MNEFFGQPLGILTKARADALYLPLTDVTTTPTASKVPRADGSHILAAGWMPSFTGDATSAAGATALTLATVNASPNTYAIATLTVNAKGLVTAASAASTTGSGSVVLATSPTIVTPTIAKLSNLSTNGFVKTSSSDGTLSIASIVSADLTTALTTPPAIGGVTPAAGAFTTLSASGALTLSGAPGKIQPGANSTTALQIAQADGTAWVTFDTTNKRVGINSAAPAQSLHIIDGNVRMDQVALAGAPSVATGAAGVLTGAYVYAVTFVTATGETSYGTLSSTVNPSSQQVNLTNIPVSADANVTSRKIYRTSAGGSTPSMKLAATIADNTTTTLSDNVADGSLTTNLPFKNTTGGELWIGANRVLTSNLNFTGLGIGAGNTSAVGGNNSVAVGYFALTAVTSGAQNTAIGHAALTQLTAGANNTGIGYQASQQLTTGNFNTSVGLNAGEFNVSGSNNTWIGKGAGLGVSTNSNSNNTGLGFNAGLAITTGGNNVLIGYQTSDALTSGSNNIAIGYDTDLPSNTASNQMTIGNLIFSAGIDGAGTTLSSGNIGIGIVAPTVKLHSVKTDAGTNTIVNAITAAHYSSGTPAAGLGVGLVLESHTTGPTVRQFGRLRALSTTATDASFATRSVWSASDFAAERDVIGIGASGTAGLLGFYPTVAAAPIIQPASANQAAVVTTPATLAGYGYTQAQADSIVTLVNQLRSDLVALGLIKGSA